MTSDVLFDMVASRFGEEAAKEWFRWFTTVYPEWAREAWQRIDKARQQPPCAQ